MTPINILPINISVEKLGVLFFFLRVMRSLKLSTLVLNSQQGVSAGSLSISEIEPCSVALKKPVL